MAHPDVVEAAVVGVPDAYRGETVKGFVVLAPGATTTPNDLVGFCRERLAAYRRPRIVELVDTLPRGRVPRILAARTALGLGRDGRCPDDDATDRPCREAHAHRHRARRLRRRSPWAPCAHAARRLVPGLTGRTLLPSSSIVPVRRRS